MRFPCTISREKELWAADYSHSIDQICTSKAIQSGSFWISACQGAGFGVHVWVMPQQHDTEDTQTESAVNMYLRMCVCVRVYIYAILIVVNDYHASTHALYDSIHVVMAAKAVHCLERVLSGSLSCSKSVKSFSGIIWPISKSTLPGQSMLPWYPEASLQHSVQCPGLCKSFSESWKGSLLVHFASESNFQRTKDFISIRACENM